MPFGAEILHVGLQRGPTGLDSSMMWALCDQIRGKRLVGFIRWARVGGIREPIKQYVGTLHIVGFAWHVFELEMK